MTAQATASCAPARPPTHRPPTRRPAKKASPVSSNFSKISNRSPDLMGHSERSEESLYLFHRSDSARRNDRDRSRHDWAFAQARTVFHLLACDNVAVAYSLQDQL